MKTLIKNNHNNNVSKDSTIIELVQVFGMSISKATKTYNDISKELGLVIKKDSKSQILIDAFIEVQDLDVQTLGEELNLAKSSINYYKTMFKISLEISSKINK